jgi:hypothetical protein
MGLQSLGARVFEQLSALAVLDLRGNRVDSFQVDTFHGQQDVQSLMAEDIRMCCVYDSYYPLSAFLRDPCRAPEDELSS